MMVTSHNRIDFDLAYLLNISLDKNRVSSSRSASITANEEASGANSPFSGYFLQLLVASHSSRTVFRYVNKVTTKKCTLHHTCEYITGLHKTGGFEKQKNISL